MSRAFEELARAHTPLGEIVLRRRIEPVSQRDIVEVILAGAGLMSSLFTHDEEQTAQLGLDAMNIVAREIVPGIAIDVLVGGLGLGYTARTVLDDARVRSLHVIDALDVVIDWHRRHLVPLGAGLTADPRCTLVHGDFFALAAGDAPMITDSAPTQFDAIFVDIDHSPRHLLSPSHEWFYTPDGLRQFVRHLRPGGVFSLWSNDPPDAEFLAALRTSFASAEARDISFWNFLIDDHTHSTIYIATR
jgi:SAM-dependent methyltransferase